MADLYFKAIWISDVHLGTPDCRVELLAEFLNASEADSIYLVGDIIDLRNMEDHWYWPDSHHGILQHLLNRARQGTNVVYIPGNHDDALKALIGASLGTAIPIVERAFHETADGRRLLIIHGDELDDAIRRNVILTSIGNGSYELVQVLNRMLNGLRGKLGYPYWSLSTFFKSHIRPVVRYIEHFETAAVQEALRWNVDGLVCGHIHKPRIKTIDGILYCNDGDWVENGTALVEHPSGQLELLNCMEKRHPRFAQTQPAMVIDSKA